MSLKTSGMKAEPNSDDMETNALTVTTSKHKGIEQQTGFTIAVTSVSGGSGKTTVAVSLAHQIMINSKESVDAGEAERPFRVCIVDLDTYDGQLSHLFWAKTPNALTLALSEDPLDQKSVRNNLMYIPRMEVHALMAPRRAVNAKYITSEFYTKTITILKDIFDVVILDSPTISFPSNIVEEVAIPMADSILLVTSNHDSNVDSVEKWRETQDDTTKVAVVVNRVPENHDPADNMLASLPVFAYIPVEEEFINTSYNNGRIDQLSTHPTVGPAFQDLVEHILELRGIKEEQGNN